MGSLKLEQRRMLLAYAVACLACAVSLLAQERPTLVEGHVLDAASSEPLGKVEVMLFELSGDEEIRATRTDADGHYQLSDVPPGTYKLTANKNGWAHQEYPSSKRAKRATRLVVEPALQLTGLDFRLERAAVVLGRVLDEEANPLVNARVTLYKSRYQALGRRLEPGRAAHTNDLGEYRIHNVQPGDYYLAVDHQDDLLTDSSVKYEGIDEGNYTRTYYPGVIDSDDAALVRVRPGELRGVDFDLRRVASVRVAGLVRVAGWGAVRPHASVEMLPRRDVRDRLQRRNTSVDETTGKFEFLSVPPGAHVLIAAEQVGGVWHYAYQSIEVQDQNVANLELRLEPVATVSGRVLLHGEGAKDYSFDDGQLTVRLFGDWHNPSNTSGEVEEGGAFVIAGVVPMSYSVGVRNLPPDAYLEAARRSGREVPDRKLKPAGGEAILDLEVVVNLEGGRIDGAVFNADRMPLGEAMVVAIPGAASRNRLPLFKTAQTDSRGRYSIRGLVPGTYRVVALEEFEPGAQWQPEFLNEHDDQGEVLQVEDGSRLTLDLDVVAGAEKIGHR